MFAKNRPKNLNVKQLKAKGHGTYKKDEKIKTSVETSYDEDVVNKNFLGSKLARSLS